MDIQLHDVKSSNIEAIGFDEQSSTLRIAFHATADVYDYASVPQSVYGLLLASPSKGEFFQEHIKDQYRFTKVNPAKERITMKKSAAAPKPVQPQPAVQPAPATPAPTPTPAATVAAPAPAQPSKQEVTITKLRDAWTEKKVDLSRMTITDDGKFKPIVVDAGWPTVQIGASGGVTVLELKSYASAFDAALIGKELFDKKRAREAKKSAQPAPRTAAAASCTCTCTAAERNALCQESEGAPKARGHVAGSYSVVEPETSSTAPSKVWLFCPCTFAPTPAALHPFHQQPFHESATR